MACLRVASATHDRVEALANLSEAYASFEEGYDNLDLIDARLAIDASR
ncbi:MAG: hypothetical protein HOI95_21545 [Chromatiales bacterium]|jgi:hypothetical protein|nr:hypothetical protein [Chromatiales bacterium]